MLFKNIHASELKKRILIYPEYSNGGCKIDIEIYMFKKNKTTK